MKFELLQKIPQHSHLQLEDRVQIEAIRRTHNGSISQILLALLTMAVVPSVSRFGWIVAGGLVLIILMQGGRFLFVRKYQQDLEKLLSNYKRLIGLTTLTALAWCVLSALVFSEFSITSYQGFPFVVDLIGYIAGLSYSLASVPRLQRFFIFFVSWPFLVAAIYEKSHYSWFVFSIYGVFLVYLFAIANTHAKDLLYTYNTEADLRSEREKLRLTINSVPGFVALSDERGEWIETSVSFKPFRDLPVFQEAEKAFRVSNLENYVQELEWIENGIENSYVLSFAKLHRPQGLVVMVGVPINELREMRRVVEVQRSKAEFSSRLSTIGEMAGGVAHEVNNPLAIIVTATYQLKNLLEQEVVPESSTHRIADKIETTALRISTIVQSLRYFAKQADRDPFEKSQVPLIVQNTLNLCQQKFIQNKIELMIGDVPEVTIPARPVQIGQVLINLLNNAFDAVQNSPVKKVKLSFEQATVGLIFSVQDSGPGIPPEIRERIFNPFFTTKQVGQGTGLGLSVSKGIIEDHQGHIEYQTGPDGTTMSFIIPWQRV